ncbi:class I SAM-dependent methyltransferase [Arthrobacter sp. zg-Y1171]|uniref:class I SAM-dependent methyltransferase n=1 Tax=Arthrobacter sp. zg-Y1171 TaxID=2964610 RepID=UPI002104FBFF|nr:class I SAM-dependent methyltransferase [Arthrobacter sp. zg-Y1171]MCQ1994015.1 class I SAM-dependent methyltransferase [Arthrobacter sp. zg-Y1171]UWX81874.1 class I SAM-dependent methyltransferase [Arthrobacter sp. zg-Y1171]
MNEGALHSVPGADARAYNLVSQAYAELIPTAGREGDPEDEQDLAMVRRFAGSLPSGAAVLDAGCGAGRMITYLDTLAPLAIEGCDISAGMVRQARKAHPHRRFEVTAMSSLPYGDGSFQGVLAWYSIIHTPSAGLPAVFAEFRRILRPGGRLLLGFQAGTGSRRITTAYGHAVELTGYLHDIPETAALLEGEDFQVDEHLLRSPTAAERYAQGFISAGKSGRTA